MPLNWGDTVAVKVTDWPTLMGFCDERTLVVVVAAVTTCATAAEVLVLKFASPAYIALTLSVPPTVSVEMENWAEPLLNVLVPSVLMPCLKVTTSPFGGAPCDDVTVAVKVTVCPYIEGFSDDVIEVVVAVMAEHKVEIASIDKTGMMREAFM